MEKKIVWPDGKRFAFTIFDDPDSQSLSDARAVYKFLKDLNLRTTIGVWTLEPGAARRNSPGETCENPEYLAWARSMQDAGFEIGLHHVAPGSMTRDEIIVGLDAFREHFGSDPLTMANHYNADAIYWGEKRLDGWVRAAYRIATRGSTRNRFFGDQSGHESFWGDLCQQRVRYCRNFVFRELNTLKACPQMPYHDPARPYVNEWFASAEASNLTRFLDTVTEASIDRLEAEGGAAILYTHFGHGYVKSGTVDERFRTLVTRIARKDGWFVPVGTLLKFLARNGNGETITAGQRGALSRRWLMSKLLHGTS